MIADDVRAAAERLLRLKAGDWSVYPLPERDNAINADQGTLADAFLALAAAPGDLQAVTAERNKLQAFKDWVHSYLDAHGVPHHPPGTHGAEGCRIGDRMDWLMERASPTTTAPATATDGVPNRA